MAAQSQSALELLLPEIQLQILFHLESFGTLHAIILASPRIYQVFRLNTRASLSTVAHRLFNPATIQAALAIERLHQIENPPFSRDTVLKFFDFRGNHLDDAFDSVLPLPVSTKLAKLDQTVKFFTNDYTQNTLPILATLKGSETAAIRTEYMQSRPAAVAEISGSESNRLRRAFCQFETYRQLFAQCSSDFNHEIERCFDKPSLAAYEQAEWFFQNTPELQVAEVACIRDYLHRRLRGVFDQVEDEILQTILAKFPNPGDKDQALDWDRENGRRYRLEDMEHYFGYYGKDKQMGHIEYLLSLGLPYIRKILESAGDERQLLFLRSEANCGAQWFTEFITEALGLEYHFSTGDTYGRLDRDPDSLLNDEDMLDLPPGWLWANSDGTHEGLVDLNLKGFRDWGYVFWDSERLQEAGILDLDPKSVEYTVFDDYQENGRPSVQERWLGPLPSHFEPIDSEPELDEELDESVEDQWAAQGEHNDEDKQDSGISAEE